MSQQRPLVVKGVNVFWGFIAHSIASQPKEVTLSLFSVGEASPEILCAVLGCMMLKLH